MRSWHQNHGVSGECRGPSQSREHDPEGDVGASPLSSPWRARSFAGELYAQLTLGDKKRTDLLIHDDETGNFLRTEVKAKQGHDRSQHRTVPIEPHITAVDARNRGSAGFDGQVPSRVTSQSVVNEVHSISRGGIQAGLHCDHPSNIEAADQI